MKKASIKRFFILYFMLTLLVNMVHPVTPTYLKSLALPDYMFGVAFAAMAVTNFLFSPFWGQLSDRIGRVNVIAISMAGYGIAQLGFGLSRTSIPIVLFRMLGGIFAGGYVVGALAYMVDLTNLENRSRYMAYYTAITSIAVSIGYLTGGLIGNYSIWVNFIVQITIVEITAVCFIIFLGECMNREHKGKNPGKSGRMNFKDVRAILTWSSAVFLIGVVFTSFATTGYDNAFNYYINSDLKLPPSYNGIIKAVTGIIGLAVNFTINVYISRKADERKALVCVLLGTFISLFTAFFIKNTSFFIAINILFYSFNAMYLPIQQSLMAKDKSGSYGLVAGLFNSAKAIGMITGSLFAGFIYTLGSRLPFIFAAIGFGAATLIYLLNYFQYSKGRTIDINEVSRTSIDSL